MILESIRHYSIRYKLVTPVSKTRRQELLPLQPSDIVVTTSTTSCCSSINLTVTKRVYRPVTTLPLCFLQQLRHQGYHLVDNVPSIEWRPQHRPQPLQLESKRRGATWLGWLRAAAKGEAGILLPVGFGQKEDSGANTTIRRIG